MSYATARIGKWTVDLVQSGTGWDVSTFRVVGNRVITKTRKRGMTLAEAKKEFTRQKRALTGTPMPKRRKKRATRPRSGMRFTLGGW